MPGGLSTTPPCKKGRCFMSSKKHLEVQRWINKAKSDLRVARMAFNDSVPEYSLACYLSQQCAEKSLKALLIWLDVRFLYKHQLDYLVELLPPDYQRLFEEMDIEWLSDWVTEGRYPGDYPEATRDDAQKAINMAEKIFTLANEILVL